MQALLQNPHPNLEEANKPKEVRRVKKMLIIDQQNPYPIKLIELDMIQSKLLINE